MEGVSGGAGFRLVASETVTLGTLPSCPVHTELAVTGDYPPDVTGTVKVGI